MLLWAISAIRITLLRVITSYSIHYTKLCDDSEQPEQASEKDEENSNLMNGVINTVNNVGKWAYDAVASGAKFV